MPSSERTGGAHLNHRRCGVARLMFNATAAAAGGAPHLLDTTTYELLGTIKRDQAPQQLASGIWIYRPSQETKVLALTFLSDTGANNETAVYDINLYSQCPDGSSTRYILGKRHRVTLTLGTTTNGPITVEPFTGSELGGSKTLRHYDTAVWTYRDTGDLQVYDKGFDAANGTGTIYVDMTGFDTIVVALQTKPATSVRELVGLAEECS